MRILLLLNGPRERYVGGADTARQMKWREYCSRATAERCGKRRCCKGVCLWNQRCVEPSDRCIRIAVPWQNGMDLTP